MPASPRRRPHNLSKEYTTGKTLYAPEYSKVAKVLNLSPILVITPGIWYNISAITPDPASDRNGVQVKILTIGDVVARQGCDCLRHILPGLKRELGAKLTIVNGENSAVGNGILPGSAQFIFDSGADVITLGNHGLRRREIYPMLEENEFLLRPANYHPSAPGRGSVLLDMGAAQVGIISLQGAAFMEPIANPFDAADREVHRLKEAGAHIILIDFHAEATAEKRALGYYLDGRVSALFGTHTHVQTADEQVLPGGTGYITDLGMTGPQHSVLGVSPQAAIEKMRTGLPVRFTNPDGPCVLEGCLFDIDEKTGKTRSCTRIRR